MSHARFALVAALGLVACTHERANVPSDTTIVATVPPAAAPVFSKDEGSAGDLAIDSASLGVDLLHVLAANDREHNVLIAPHSIETALAMAYAGARGETALEMQKTLHFPAGDAVHEQIRTTDATLATRNHEGVVLDMANAVWSAQDLAVVPAFDQLIQRDYATGGFRLVDFGQTEKARVAINAWVDDATKTMIPEVLKPGVLTPDTRMALVNAVYLDAKWKQAMTADGTITFSRPDGTEVEANAMATSAHLPFTEGDDYRAVALPYDGGDLAFVAIQPTSNASFADWEGKLTGRALNGMLGALAEADVQVRMPKLKLETSVDLVSPLQTLGMSLAFGSGADFSGISQEPLSISHVIHQAVATIDEKGTEAAAATIVVFGSSSGGGSLAAHMELDRPFVFAIVDRSTRTVLFVGHVVTPT